jgi:hypothetical protein
MEHEETEGKLRKKDSVPEQQEPRVWHPFRLQTLNISKFIRAANKILRGEDLVAKFLTFGKTDKKRKGRKGEK